MRTPSSQKCRLDLAPPQADRFHLGSYPHRLRPGTSPQALRIPLAVDTPPTGVQASGGFRSVLAVSSFRLRARLDLSIPSAFSGQRGYEPRFWIWRPSFERQRDFNPPEQRAAQRALPDSDLPSPQPAPRPTGAADRLRHSGGPTRRRSSPKRGSERRSSRRASVGRYSAR